ncbi:MAG TPA: acyclic terpene utilization AtuA family protein, partial [Rhizomicrobium sp.]|nr:acyclic terpene utilization AtuA family protein [Rhizomicrobium sp.]
TVAEQLLYEIGDPRAYVLPDVVCDLTDVELKQVGPDRVEVSGARGHAPTAEYKVSATYQDGFRATSIFTMVGFNAATKIRRMCETIFTRTRAIFRQKDLPDYRRAAVRILGTEDIYGAHANPLLVQSRELVGRMDVHHDDRRALEIWASEIAPSGTGMAPGRLQLVGGRPSVAPMVRLFSCLVPKKDVQPIVDFEGERIEIPIPVPAAPFVPQPPPKTASNPTKVPGAHSVALVKLAYGRSGDKGDSANIAIIARKPEFLPIIREQVTEARVAEWFAHLVEGPVTRYDVPGLRAVNFVLERALDGGGAASLRPDTQGKSYAQLLLAMPIEVPPGLRLS